MKRIVKAEKLVLNGVSISAEAGWKKYTFSHTAFQAAALTNNIPLLTLAAKDIVEGVLIKTTTAFSGGAISAYSLTVGITGNVGKFLPAYDVFAAVAGSNYAIEGIPDAGDDFNATESIKLFATSVGANLSASTAGSVDIYVKLASQNTVVTNEGGGGGGGAIFASVSRTAAQSMTNGVYTKIIWDTVESDASSVFSGGSFTIPASWVGQAKGLITANYFFPSGYPYNQGLTAVFKNGVVYKRTSHFVGDAGTSGPSPVSIPIVGVANDVFDIRCYQSGPSGNIPLAVVENDASFFILPN